MDKIKYNTIFLNKIKYKVLRKIIKLNNNLTQKSVYFSVFHNDSVSEVIQISGLYESEILIPLFRIMSKQFNFVRSSAIDVGANIGNHTIFFSDIFEKVVSFEPNPITFKLLQVNTFTLKNVHIFNLGLSDSDNELTLSVLAGNIGGSSITINHKSDLEHKIKAIPLDDFRELPPNIELMKIDVEGMENLVLKGAKQVITTNKPIILFEQWSSQFRNGSSDAVDFLLNLDYSMYILVESNYSKNKWIRELKRIPLMIFNRSLKYKLQRIDYFDSIGYGYPMIVAIHKSKADSEVFN
jgi:FkbM family methyltransferase